VARRLVIEKIEVSGGVEFRRTRIHGRFVCARILADPLSDECREEREQRVEERKGTMAKSRAGHPS
jgi:hypothetical protein